MRVKLGYQPQYYHHVIDTNSIGDGFTVCGTSFTLGRVNKARWFWPFWGTKLCPKCWEIIYGRK